MEKTTGTMIQGDGFAYEFLYNGGPFTMLRVVLPHGVSFKAQSDAMVAMSDTIDVEGRTEGGILAGLARKFLTQDSFFFQTLRATRGAGEVLLSPNIMGDLIDLEMDGRTVYQLQKGSFFAASEGVALATAMQSLGKGLFSGDGFFVQEVSGKGTLIIESFGAVHVVDIPAGQSMVIDNHHLVAWDAETSYSLEKAAKGFWSSFTSGENIVCRFRGPGRVLIQTRNPVSFVGWLSGLMPQSTK